MKIKNAHKKQLATAVYASDWDGMAKVLARYRWREECRIKRLMLRALAEQNALNAANYRSSPTS